MHARKRVIRLVNSERGTFVIGADNVLALPAEERKDTRVRGRQGRAVFVFAQAGMAAFEGWKEADDSFLAVQPRRFQRLVDFA